MYKVAICDDEKLLRDALVQQLKKYEKTSIEQFEYTYYESGETLLKSKLDFDILFLDICMEQLDGIETAKCLRKINRDMIIIFLTSYENSVYDAFEVNAFRYLLKPIEQDKLFLSLGQALSTLKEKELHCLNIKTESGMTKLHYKDILYFESARKKVRVQTDKEEYFSLIKIGQLEEDLREYGFFRSHKGYLVNLDRVKQYTNEEIVMENDDKVYLSRLKINAFKEAFIKYLGRGRKL